MLASCLYGVEVCGAAVRKEGSWARGRGRGGACSAGAPAALLPHAAHVGFPLACLLRGQQCPGAADLTVPLITDRMIQTV